MVALWDAWTKSGYVVVDTGNLLTCRLIITKLLETILHRQPKADADLI